MENQLEKQQTKEGNNSTQLFFWVSVIILLYEGMGCDFDVSEAFIQFLLTGDWFYTD